MQGAGCGNQGRSNGGKMNHTATRGAVRLELGIVRLELKYCERCGGLWTREHGVLQSRCERCRVEEKQLTKLWRARSNRFNRSAQLAGFGNESTTIPGGLPA
jgi:Zn-finger nucleic acid-binding protein